MRVFVMIVVVLLYAGLTSAQTNNETKLLAKALETDAPWIEGKIIQNDNSEENGEIRYNDRTGVLSFKSGANSGTYSARNLAGFQIIDPTTNESRVFISLPCETRKGAIANQFLEIVRQYKQFAVMVKTDPVDVYRDNKDPLMPTIRATELVLLNQITTVYFVDDELRHKAYLQYQARHAADVGFLGIPRWGVRRSKIKIIDKKLPRKIMGTHYSKVKAYAKENILEWRERDDLLKILDYYDSLLNP